MCIRDRASPVAVDRDGAAPDPSSSSSAALRRGVRATASRQAAPKSSEPRAVRRIRPISRSSPPLSHT
eukprot:8019918-Alexandrium_andersonii.AAC.1